MANTLYDSDLQLWIEQTIEQLKSRKFESLDIEHLIEELTDLGKSEKNALISNLTVLLVHLLKLRVQNDAPEMMKASWYSSVIEHRQRVLKALATTPSLSKFAIAELEEAYLDARKLAIKESKLARFGVRMPEESEYPNERSYSIEQILDEDFYGS
ncbi:MAG: DUF29 domain-containing protein [Phormidium tanganyikae FI6-MK23]|jgi:hypothetical protein|nr:DUF29 domain-containing protein [Phormidium tanganyikae FI6-MK23]